MNIVLTIAVLLLAAATYSAHKRLNQIERDMSERGIQFREKTQAEVERDERVLRPLIIEKTTGEVLRGAGVEDKKAYAAADLAVQHGWQLLDIQENIKMVRFMKAGNGDVTKINIYYGGKGGKRDLYTVATALNHPHKGKTQLFRKHITKRELEELLKNPRAHTRKGYYQNGK